MYSKIFLSILIIMINFLVNSFSYAHVVTQRGNSVGWYTFNYIPSATFSIQENYNGGSSTFYHCIVSSNSTETQLSEYYVRFNNINSIRLKRSGNNDFLIDFKIKNNNSGITKDWYNYSGSLGYGNTSSQCAAGYLPLEITISITKQYLNGLYRAGRYCTNQQITMSIYHQNGRPRDTNHSFNICMNWSGTLLPPEIQVKNLDDLNFGSYSGDFIPSITDDFCVYLANANSYNLTLDDGGNLNEFDIISGSNFIPYNIFIKNKSGSSIQILENQPVSLTWFTTDQFCSINSQLISIVTSIDNNLLNDSPVGNYTSTLNIIVSPE